MFSLAALLTIARPAVAQPCVGDCDGNDRVEVNELIQGVNISLGNVPAFVCAPLDPDGSESVTISELITAVGNGLDGCPPDIVPAQPVIALAAAESPSALLLAWLPVTDDATPEDAIVYEIHRSISGADFIPSAASRTGVVVGATQARVDGFEPGTTYYLRLVAMDDEENTSVPSAARRCDMPRLATIVDPNTVVARAVELGLMGPAQVTASSLVFPDSPEARLPEPGSILVGDGADTGYFRRVDGVTRTGAAIEIDTRSATIADATTQFGISSSVTVLPLAGGQFASYTTRASAHDPDGDAVTARWQHGALQLAETAPGRGVPAGSDPMPHDIDLGEFGVEIGLEFEPQLITEAEFTLVDGIRSGRIIAEGVMTFRAEATYAFSRAGRVESEELLLFKRSGRYTYPVGGLWVIQEVVFTLSAQAAAEASANIDASAGVSSRFEARFGVEYDPATRRWEPVRSFDDTHTVLADLSVGASATAEVRLIPRVEVTFYEAITGRLSLEPSVNGQIGVAATSHPVCGPLAVTQFDVWLAAECLASADFSIFALEYELLAETQICDLGPLPVLGLPSLELESTPDPTAAGRFLLHGSAVPGANNPLSLPPEWTITAMPLGEIQPGQGLEAVFQCHETGGTSVTVSATGRITGFAPVCADVTVDCRDLATPTARPVATSTATAIPTPSVPATATQTATPEFPPPTDTPDADFALTAEIRSFDSVQLRWTVARNPPGTVTYAVTICGEDADRCSPPFHYPLIALVPSARTVVVSYDGEPLEPLECFRVDALDINADSLAHSNVACVTP